MPHESLFIILTVRARKENKITYNLKDNNLSLESKEEPISNQTDGLFWKHRPITVENPSYGLTFKPDYQTRSTNMAHGFDSYDALFSEDYTPIYLTPHLNRGQTPEKLILQSIEDFYESWVDPVWPQKSLNWVNIVPQSDPLSQFESIWLETLGLKWPAESTVKRHNGRSVLSNLLKYIILARKFYFLSTF